MYGAYSPLFFAGNQGGGIALNSGLIAFWKLEEASGNRVDSTGNTKTLTPSGAPGNQAGKIGNAVAFVKTSSQYLLRADETAFRMFRKTASVYDQAGSTVAGWINLVDITFTVVIAAKEGFDISYFSGGWHFRVFNAVPATIADASVVISPTFGTWYFICARWDGGTGIDLSINNGTRGTASIVGTPNPGDATEFHLGVGAVSDTAFTNGAQDAWGIWNRRLSDAEVAYLYNNGTGRELP